LNPAPQSQHGRIEWQLAGILSPLATAAGLRALGQFNLGEEGDYRVPDGGLVRPGPDGVYVATAVLVVEIVSPGDETRNKLPFYAAHRVSEMLIVDPQTRSVEWLALAEDGEYAGIDRSGVIALTVDALAAQIDWP
jgi:Uma2 family endonuclease